MVSRVTARIHHPACYVATGCFRGDQPPHTHTGQRRAQSTHHHAGGGAWRRPDSRPVALLACDESSGSPRCHSFVQQHHCGFGLSKDRIHSRFSTPLSPSIMKPSEALTIPMQHTPIPIIRMALEPGGGVGHMRRPTLSSERASVARHARAPCWGTLLEGFAMYYKEK